MSLNILIDNQQNEYYLQLSSQLQAVYRDCVEQLRHGKLIVSTNLTPYEGIEAQLELVTTAIDFGCPELFFIEKKTQIIQEGNSVSLVFTSKYPSNRLAEMYSELMKEADTIINEINYYAVSDEERVRMLNQVFCTSIETVNNTRGECGDAYGALINKTARCEGVCKAAQLILNRLNIKNVIMYGKSNKEGQTEDHSWTVIWVYNQPYGFDFTWNIGATQFGIPAEDYMFLSEEDLNREHTKCQRMDISAVNFSDLTQWYLSNTEITYRSDMGNVIFKPYNNHQYAVLRLLFEPDFDEVKENVYDWYLYEMGGDTMYGSFYYRYNQGMEVLTVYILTDE